MIWDTGTYSILPRRSKYAPALDPDSGPSDDEASPSSSSSPTQQSLLHAAFQTRKIKIRLHGTRLPDPYVVYIRLTKTEDAAGRAKADRSKKPARRRRRGAKASEHLPETSSGSEGEEEADADIVPTTNSQLKEQEPAEVSALEKELRELEDEQVRRTNAYTGATNSIGSIHQRAWFLSMDRALSGFAPKRREIGRPLWQRDGETEHSDTDSRLSYPFYVYGRDGERSVITGRLASEILRDEGVVNFVPRMGWKPVVN